MVLSTEDLAGLNREAQITLVLLDLSIFGIADKFRFTNEINPDNTPIAWGGQEFTPIPYRLEGEKLDSRNQLATPTLTIGEIYDDAAQLQIGAFVARYDDLVGAKITVLTTYVRHLDNGSDPDPTAILRSEIYTLERKKNASRLGYSFELSTGNNLQGAKIPKRQVTNNCSWPIYRGEGCAYAGQPVTDINGNPLTPIRLSGCVLGVRSIEHPNLSTAGVEIGQTVVGAGIPPGTQVTSIALNGLSCQTSKDMVPNANARCWFAADACPRLRESCKQRFGVERSGVVTPGSAIILSPPGVRGQWEGTENHFVQCSNLAAGLPVARRILSVSSGATIAITAVNFSTAGGQKRWIFSTASQLTANVLVEIAGVHPLINGSYVLAADSFAGVGPNQFALLAKPQDIGAILVSPANTQLLTLNPHQLTTGNQIYIEGTNTDGGVALDGLRQVTSIGTTTGLTVNYGSSAAYVPRNRDAFTSTTYMEQFKLGTIVLNSTTAPNQEGYFYFATPLTPAGGTVAIAGDTITLDQPVDLAAIAGTYNLIIGGNKYSGLLNFGGQPGASVINY